MENGSAQEYLFKFIADPKGRYSTSKQPWHSCKNASEALGKVEDPKSIVDYGITYSLFSDYILRQEGKCDEIVVFEMPALSRPYEVVWYYEIRTVQI